MMADSVEHKKVQLAISNILNEVDFNIKAVEKVVEYHQEAAKNFAGF